jgi:HAD superfamily phosphoserine phosphatase-like hydrolase
MVGRLCPDGNLTEHRRKANVTQDTNGYYLIGPFAFDPVGLVVYKQGALQSFEEQPLKVLRVLTAHEGILVSKDDLIGSAWPDAAESGGVSDDSLVSAIRKLRRAFGKWIKIETAPRRGYRLAQPKESKGPRAQSTSTGTIGPAPLRRGFRLVVFDLDGTLLRGLDYSWQVVWEHLGYDDEVRRLAMQRYLEHEITYEDWCKYCLRMYMAKGLRREDFKKITNAVSLTKNFYPTIRALRQAGLVLALISGGIDVFLYEKIPDADKVFDYVFINEFVFDGKGLLSRIVPTKFDFDRKLAAVRQICEKRGFALGDVVLVGEGINDFALADALGCGNTIAYSPRSERLMYKARPGAWIKDDDLSLILPHIL